MRCADARPYLSAYADGELAEPLRALVGQHIADCAECRAAVQRAQAVDRLLASLPRTAPSPEVYERVQAAVARHGLDPVVREPLAPSRWAQEIGMSARAVKRLLTPRVVYPQEPEHEDDEVRPAGGVMVFQRRAPWVVGALPAVAALLLIALALTLFSGLGFGHNTSVVDVTATPATQVGAGLRQAEIALQRQGANISFTPVMPTYLPSSAQLNKLTADKATDTLLIVWTVPVASGVRELTLREAPMGQGFAAIGCQGAAAAFAGEWLQWGLPGANIWTALTCGGVSNAPTVGQQHLAADAQQPAVDIALSATPRTSAAVATAVNELRIASLSMDSDYQAQATFERALAAHHQPTNNVYLHYTALASAVNGQQWSITGETNTPFIQANGHRLERITVVSGGASATYVVNGSSAIRFFGKDTSTFEGLAYPASNPFVVGPNGEPWANTTRYFGSLVSLMTSGEVWKTKSVTLNNRAMIELVMVDTPMATTIYVDANTYAVTRVEGPSVAGPGAAGAPNRLVADNVVCPGMASSAPDCSISYSALWITTAPNSPNDFSFAPPMANLANGRTLAFHLKPSDKDCQTV